MSDSMQTLEQHTRSDYKYGFSSNIETDKLPKGLNEGTVRAISKKKNEPEWLTEWRLKAYEHQERERRQAEAQQQAQTQAVNDLTAEMGEAEQVARTELPDYDHAMDYQVKSRAGELKALGHPEDQIPELIRSEYLHLIHEARQMGQNPAFLVYQQAKSRGYAGPPPESTETPPSAPVSDVAQKQLDAMRRGQETPKTTRGSGGGAKTGSVSEEMLMNAKGAEFDKLWAQFEKQNAG